VRRVCSLLRQNLGRASRKYVENFHSYDSAAYLFGSIYDKLLRGTEIDLLSIFHPLTSEYVRARHVDHPLKENKLRKTESIKC